MNETVIVIDFETTGLSPSKGDRATEVAAVRLVGDEIVDSFQSLINPGMPVPMEIEKLTGITSEMVRNAPCALIVMRRLHAFIHDSPLVAHNARFDRAFLKAEYEYAGIQERGAFACTMKLAKRVYPRSPNFKLHTLLEYADIPHQKKFHRALADAVNTANLWLHMKCDIKARYGIRQLSHAQLARIARLSPASITGQLKAWRGQN